MVVRRFCKQSVRLGCAGSQARSALHAARFFGLPCTSGGSRSADSRPPPTRSRTRTHTLQQADQQAPALVQVSVRRIRVSKSSLFPRQALLAHFMSRLRRRRPLGSPPALRGHPGGKAGVVPQRGNGPAGTYPQREPSILTSAAHLSTATIMGLTSSCREREQARTRWTGEVCALRAEPRQGNPGTSWNRPGGRDLAI